MNDRRDSPDAITSFTVGEISSLVFTSDITFMRRKAKLYYTELDDFRLKEEKLAWLNENPISKIDFDRIEPDEQHNWINQTDNDWESLKPLIDKEVKPGGSHDADRQK